MSTAVPTAEQVILPGDRVECHLWNDKPPMFGTLLGRAELPDHPLDRQLVLVLLEQGFYSEDREVFVQILSVHRSNIVRCPSQRAGFPPDEGR